MKTLNLGSIGRIHISADMNGDRVPPSKQVWVELMKNESCIGTASGNCVAETGEIEADDGRSYRLSAREMLKLEEMMDKHEGK